MSFLILCAVLAFVFQLFALRVSEKRFFRVLPFAVMEAFPLGAILYYAIVRPHDFLFSWMVNAVFALYIAAAILLGCAIAWLLSQR